MKPIIRILLIVLLLVLYSCKSIALYDTSTDYDFKFDLYSQVKMYFRANLKYPTVNELWDYCWKITNEVNDNTFSYHLMTLIRRHIKMSQVEKSFCSIYLYIKRKFRSNLRKEQCLFFGRIKNGLKLSLI